VGKKKITVAIKEPSDVRDLVIDVMVEEDIEMAEGTIVGVGVRNRVSLNVRVLSPETVKRVIEEVVERTEAQAKQYKQEIERVIKLVKEIAQERGYQVELTTS